jgi:hypothetical protein
MAIALISLVLTAIAAVVPAIGLYLQNKQLKRDLERERTAFQKETDYKHEAVPPTTYMGSCSILKIRVLSGGFERAALFLRAGNVQVSNG